MNDLTPERLAELGRLHVPSERDPMIGFRKCEYDRNDWPCATHSLLGMLAETETMLKYAECDRVVLRGRGDAALAEVERLLTAERRAETKEQRRKLEAARTETVLRSQILNMELGYEKFEQVVIERDAALADAARIGAHGAAREDELLTENAALRERLGAVEAVVGRWEGRGWVHAILAEVRDALSKDDPR